MRRAQIAIVTAIALPAIAVGAWRAATAAAERSTTGNSASPPAPVPPDLLEKSRGFRELLEAVGRRRRAAAASR